MALRFLALMAPAWVRPDFIDAFRQGLRQLGYVEGKAVIPELRYPLFFS